MGRKARCGRTQHGDRTRHPATRMPTAESTRTIAFGSEAGTRTRGTTINTDLRSRPPERGVTEQWGTRRNLAQRNRLRRTRRGAGHPEDNKHLLHLHEEPAAITKHHTNELVVLQEAPQLQIHLFP